MLFHLPADQPESSEARRLQAEAQRCRRLAAAMGDRETAARLDEMAEEFEAAIEAALTRH